MNLIKALLLTISLFSAAHAAGQVGAPLAELPIQDGGRVKPFDTFARETLRLVYGKSSYNNKSAVEVVFTWLLVPEHWLATPIVEVRHAGLKEALKITSPDRYFTPEELFRNERVPLLFQDLASRRERDEKLNPYFQAVQRLQNQLGLFQAVRGGTALHFVPDPKTDSWKAVADLEGEMQESFLRLTKGFVDSVAHSENSGEGRVPPSEEFKAAVTDFMNKARAIAPEKYASPRKITLELHLNNFHPFQWAWIVYLMGVVGFLFFGMWNRAWLLRFGWLCIFAGFALHTYGMCLRMYLAGRPPVSNMYETVVWVPWGCLLFGMIMARIQKSRLLLIAATCVAIFCLILTDLAPTVLDGSLQPLEPVLRSTFWLSTHVLIITLSYAAFFLAFAMGDVLLFFYLRDEKYYAAQIQSGTQSIYRAMQIGVVLLAAGTILGGIWADYSWGRFWGWDPKETWALISLLGYLAILHGRLVGWVRNYELAALSIVTFSLVIMAWYGVNFVLGAGLHSYGFGAGGVEYVTAFVAVHLLYVAYVSTLRYGRLKKV